MRAIAAVALLVGLLAPACADDGVRLDAALTTTPPILVGQQATLAVTLSATSPFAGSPIFDLPRIPGAVLMEADPHAVLGSATIGGASWLSQRRELAFFAQRPGSFTIPAITVRFGTASGPGGAAVPHALQTAPVAITAALPPGVAAGDDVVATTRLTVEEQWTPKPMTAHVGDAFTRTVTRTVAGVPAMLLPPLPVGEAANLAAYPKPPQVSDAGDRGDLVGTRVDVVTYVCTRPGRVELPAVAFGWWNLRESKLETETLAAVHFDVAGAQVPTSTWALGAGAILGALALVVWRRRAIADRWHRRRAAFAASEPGRFRTLERACRSGDAPSIWRALLAWLDVRHAGPGCTTVGADLLARDADPELHREVSALEDALAAGRARVDAAGLAVALENHRRRVMHGHRALATALPDLNPH